MHAVFLLLLAVSLATVRSSTATGRTVPAEYTRTVSYDGDVVVRCSNKDHRNVKIVMAQSSVDVWRIGSDGEVDMRMSRPLSAVVLRYIPLCRIVVKSVEAHVQAAEQEMTSRKQSDGEQTSQVSSNQKEMNTFKNLVSEAEMKGQSWLNEYYDYDRILEWYNSMSKKHSHLMRYVSSIGRTEEGRHLAAVHITASTNPARYRIYLQCLIHAREWISGSVCMYVTNYLINNYTRVDKVKNLLDSMEFVIVPVVNPDGYVHTWRHNRLWRKNRAVNQDTRDCIGVDLNRNYPAGWGVAGRSSSNPCSNTYHGPSPASEPETKSIMAYFKANSPIVAAIDFHSYGQLILRPWGFQASASSSENKLKNVGDAIAKAVYKTSHVHYTSERSIDLYQACGIASDWFYSNAATKHNKGYRAASFTIELRDQGTYGFLLPASQISSTSREALAAVLQLAKKVADSPIKSQSTHGVM